MAGIYIHIPFCKKACNYCNFHFSVNNQALPKMAKAIVAETLLQKHYLNEPVETIYFGGGTPSLLSANQLNPILAAIRENFQVEKQVEITLEANPDDINASNLAVWKLAGINRLSIGIQSFFEEDLQWMGRAHNAEQAIQCIELAQAAGFDNLSIDLIYGGPTLSDNNWKYNIERAIQLKIPHLSCYALTVEPKTALAKKIKEQVVPNVDPEKQAEHFAILTQLTQLAGYEHYEISNFALPTKRSKHNANYWQGKHYLGLGPAAHSFNGNSRQWNIANNSLYITAIQQQQIPFEIEQLTQQQKINEYIMTALRTIEGINLTQLKSIGEQASVERILKEADRFIQQATITLANGHLIITPKGKFYADGIAAELFQL